MSVRSLARLMTALCAVPLIALHAPAAEAAGGELEFSLDGQSWTAAPPTSLFEQQMVLVPGASVTTTLHLRNAADTSGLLSLAVDDVRASDTRSAQHFGLSAETERGTGLDNRRFAELDGACVGSPQRIEPGQQTEVRLTVSLDAETRETDAQGGWVDFALGLGFIDAAAHSSREVAEGGCGPTQDLQVPALPPAGPGHGENTAVRAAREPHVSRERAPSAAAGTTGRAAPHEEQGMLAVTGSDLWTVGMFGVGMLAAGSMLLASRRREERS